ncbi:hypothetical protein COO91_03406 [Nostoc flagelliforme CCNUN1]|uniref:Uncharacterized protein n=1 Tax=Nostoc flagelliforme CCNUN1 TaxID=2038116 RepID=A0A2K8SPV7_9NOSO|nr:hypothetical protein COO91_03406 [Nostoc flagelliforme CCNUN1]
MFDHQRINHLALPSVLLNERSRLPKVSDIYFAATDSEGVLYIGLSGSFETPEAALAAGIEEVKTI